MLSRIKKYEFSRYLSVGAISAAIINFVVLMGEYLSIHYGISLLAAFILGTAFAYLAHASITFVAPKSLKSYSLYITANLFGLAITATLIVVLHEGFAVPIEFATPVTTVIMLAYNYLAAYWTIAQRKKGGQD